MNCRQSLLAVPALALAAFLAAPAPASAEFNVCNQTESRVGVAIGYLGDAEWATEGWWNLTPGACEAILPGPLSGRFYYIFARDWDKGGDWGGKTPMCTQTRVFTINGIKDCAQRGYDISGFFEVDTGSDENWTVQLTESGAK